VRSDQVGLGSGNAVYHRKLDSILVKTSRVLGALGALVIGASAVAFLPTAANADNTATTFSLTGGSLTLSVPATATLTNGASGATTITGNLGTTSVTDERGGTTNWTASGASTAFTGALTGGSSSTAVSYTGGVVSETGTITVADGTAKTLTGVATSVVAPTSLSGNNTASWAPVLNVTMPAGALADSYSGTVTTSVL
jgi:hypothetical protein